MPGTKPPIKAFMTLQPHIVEIDSSVSSAKQIMFEKNLRHLPVVDGGRLVGILSDRDIKVALNFYDSDPEQMPVRDICIMNPYETGPDTPIDEVVTIMAEKRYGSAVITQAGEVVGIFTTVDACKALAKIINAQFYAA